MAQPFRIQRSARDWFAELRAARTFRTDFDAFYFCFMAGITERRKNTVAFDETAELVDYFPDKYGMRSKLLVGLFLTRELQELGVTMAEKNDVHEAIAKLVNPAAQHHLSDAGVREFNRYANGGYDVLLDWFDDKPRYLDLFLLSFKERVHSTLGAVILFYFSVTTNIICLDRVGKHVHAV